MIHLIFIFCTQPIETFRVPMEDIHLARNTNPQVYPSGIFANSTDALYQFDFQGRLILKIQGSKKRFQSIRTFHVSSDFIWIADDTSYTSFFYDREGVFLFQDKEVYSNNIQHLKDDIYIISPALIHPAFFPNDRRKLSPFLRNANFVSRPYPRLLKTMRLDITSQEVRKVEELRSFYKATESLSEINLELKKIWAFKKANTFTIINQIDTFKSVYSPVHLNQERQIPPERPYQPRTTPLNLPNFQEIQGTFEPKSFYEDKKDYQRDVLCWQYTRSKIENIVPVPFGYLMGYTAPKVRCERGSLVIAQMNRDFRTQRVLLELDRYGILMGVNQNKTYVLVPNIKIDEVLPIGADPEIWVFDLDQ